MQQIANSLPLLAFLLSVATASAQSITNPIVGLKNHILGITNLTAAQIVANGNNIQASIRQVGTNSVALAAALDLVATFDASANKALFTSGSTTYGGFTRDGSGDELAQALFDLQQGIIDYAYNAANLVNYYSLLNNTEFGTSTYFPGAVAPPADASQGYSVQINASHLGAWGAPVEFVDYAARRPTGCYLAPGSIAYVTVPAALVNKGYSVRVGAHYWDLSAKTTVKRLDRVSIVYSITSTTTRIANPLGGGIYVEVPYQITNGIVTVGITNVVRSPLFRNTIVHQTTAAEWLTERTNPGKWADFESERFMMQVPRSWIYAYNNANSVMADWDKAMDAVSDLMGLPHVRSKTVLYVQPDVLIRGTANEPGYPQSNTPYNPNTVETGNKDHYFLTGPQDSPWETLHECGHSQLFTKFTGETESAVNLLYVPAMNRKFGVSLDDAYGLSIGAVDTPANVSISLDQGALSWIMVNKFRANTPMDDTDMKYQHRGHGKYADIAHLFGWEALGDFWHSVNMDYMTGGANYPANINADPTDGRILRMSQAVGADLTPLIYMWGMQPDNVSTLKTSIANAGLKPSVYIYDRLKHYQSIVPTNLTQFKAHYQAINSCLPANDATWYQTMNTQFTPDIGYASITQLQNIINLYFPNGRPPIGTNRWSGAVSATWNTSTLNWKTVATGAATNYVGGNPGDYVIFDDLLTANSAITLTNILTPGSVTFSNTTTAYSLSGSGRIAGNGPVLKLGTGTVTINNSNVFSGGVTVGYGTLVLKEVNTGSAFTVTNNAVLRVSKTGALGEDRLTVGTAQTDTSRLELTGGITVANTLGFKPRISANNVAAHFLNLSGTNFLSPSTDVPYGTGGNVLSLQSDNGRLVLTAGVNVTASAPRVVVLQGAGDGEVQGPISTNASVLKLGAGSWTLSGSSSLAYGMTVSNGTLVVNGSLTATTNVTTIAGGTLSGNGIIAGAVKVNSGGAITAGNAVGAGNLTLGSLTLGTAGGSQQAINVTAGSAIVALAGALTNNGLTTLNVASAGDIANGVYPLLTYMGPTITSGFALGSVATNAWGTLLYNPGVIALNVTNGNAMSGSTRDIYTEIFNGAGSSLNGKTTTTGGGIWSANSIVTDNGVLTASAGSAVLPFTPVANRAYTLSIDFNYSSGSGGWLGLGFSSATAVSSPGGSTTADRFSNANVPGYSWMICNTTNIANVFQGGRTTNPIAYTSPTLAAGPHTLKIILDTTGNGSSFKANFLVDNTSVTGGPTNINVALSTIKSVGFTQYGTSLTGSTVDNFSLVWSSASTGGAPSFPLGGLVRLPDGNFSLTVTGAVGTPYRLWASTNAALTPIVSAWTLLSSGTVAVSPFAIIDQTATNYPKRFYLFSAP